ncbi:MAG: mechanosensitive ion channel [Anaerolineae bacterium]|nr:mechanosensitive ion channel [Anaerolineae bacterium]NIN95838.1 mechanosensitive ion channel [Anaerolineae bacterium]NIQ78804.1 mechanosensitive ion channel [Anaerolineae bacterium]
MEEVLLSFVEQILGTVPTLVGAVVVLIVGWLVAWLVSALVRRALHRTTLDNRLASWVAGEEEAEGIAVEKWIGRGVFWLLMIFVLMAFFQVLGLTIITEPLNQLLIQVFQYAPRLAGAGLLLLVAWVLASVLRFLVSRVLKTAGLDERLGTLAGIEEERIPLAKTLGDAVYWLVFLLFLPAVLGALAVEGLLEPVQGMIDNILGFLPNIFAAGLILAIGWFAARIVQRIVANLLVAVGTDRLSERVGLDRVLGKQRLSEIVGLVLYVLVLIPVLIAALNALQLQAITEPASNMLNLILTALPSIFAAGLLVMIAYVVGRLVASLITNVLTGIGFNAILARLGLVAELPEGQRTPSEIAGYLILVGVMLLAAIEASRLLGFETLGTLIAELTVFLGQVILGLIIFGIGLYLANLAAEVVKASGAAQSGLLALAARVSILILAGAIALSQMGLASEIIQIAFGVLLAAIALATALAFGLGGREIAARELDKWLESVGREK